MAQDDGDGAFVGRCNEEPFEAQDGSADAPHNVILNAVKDLAFLY